MTEENIIEMAKRYGQLENIDHGLAWVLSEDALLDFVQTAIQEETKEYRDLIAHAVEVLRRQVKPVLKSRQQPKTPLADHEILQVAAKSPPVHPSMLQGYVTLGDLRKMTTDFARAIERKIWEEKE